MWTFIMRYCCKLCVKCVCGITNEKKTWRNNTLIVELCMVYYDKRMVIELKSRHNAKSLHLFMNKTLKIRLGIRHRGMPVIQSTHLPPSAAYMRQWIGSALVQIMDCSICSAKPLSKPMLGYCRLDPGKQNSLKNQSKHKTFHSGKCIWKYRLQNGGHFVHGKMS